VYFQYHPTRKTNMDGWGIFLDGKLYLDYPIRYSSFHSRGQGWPSPGWSWQGGLGQDWHARAGPTLASSGPPLVRAGPVDQACYCSPGPGLASWGGSATTGPPGPEAGIAGQTPTPGPGLAQSWPGWADPSQCQPPLGQWSSVGWAGTECLHLNVHVYLRHSCRVT
jgi:hypothetical protein